MRILEKGFKLLLLNMSRNPLCKKMDHLNSFLENQDLAQVEKRVKHMLQGKIPDLEENLEKTIGLKEPD